MIMTTKLAKFKDLNTLKTVADIREVDEYLNKEYLDRKKGSFALVARRAPNISPPIYFAKILHYRNIRAL